MAARPAQFHDSKSVVEVIIFGLLLFAGIACLAGAAVVAFAPSIGIAFLVRFLGGLAAGTWRELTAAERSAVFA